MVSFKNDFMNNVLILGASGLLGQTLVRHFVANKFRIGALSRGYKNYSNGLINSHAVDVLDFKELDLIVAQYDIIINCIGQITYPIEDCIKLNSVGVKNIIDSVNNNNNYLVHISTVSIYGSSPSVDEESSINPESVYGTIKYFAEYQISQNLDNFMILRVSNLYGKGQNKGVLSYILETFFKNETQLFFNNDGSLNRYYLHINDLTSIIEMSIINQLKGVYNVTGSDSLTLKQLIALCEKILNYTFDVSYQPTKPIDNIDNIDDLKISKAIDVTFKNNLELYLKGLVQ